MKRLLKGGRVVDPANGIDGMFDVLIDGDRIAQVGRDLPDAVADGGEVLHLPAGFVVCPGFIDMHVHLREPGQEHKETVATGVAVGGGRRLHGRRLHAEHEAGERQRRRHRSCILQKAREANLARVYPIGAVSRGQKGEELADIAELREAGCVAVTDDGQPVATAILARRALEYTSMFGMPVIEHCEDQSLKGDGVAHEGPGRVVARAARHSRRGRGDHRRPRHPAGGDDRRPRPHRAHERVDHARGRAPGQEPRREGDRARWPAPLHADRRDAGGAGPLRHQHQDEPAAARGRAIATPCSPASSTAAST